MATTVRSGTGAVTGTRAGQEPRGGRGGRHYNWPGGLAGWFWLAVVVVPIYWIIITSFKTQSNYFATNPLAPATSPTMDNYRLVIASNFTRYFINSVVVTVGAVVPAVLIAFMASFAI